MNNTTQGRTRDELEHELDAVEQANDAAWVTSDDLGEREHELRQKLRTICSHCQRSGAVDHYDREGMYAGRYHDACATPADRHVEAYRWQPGDEPLEEEA
jgi:hypothetical protein